MKYLSLPEAIIVDIDGICPGEIVEVTELIWHGQNRYLQFTVKRHNGVLVTGCGAEHWELYTPNFLTYREEVLRTALKDMAPTHNRFSHETNALLTNAAMGLVGEAAEVSELVKKFIFHGTHYDRDKFIKELGDVRWYLEVLCYLLNVSIKEVESENVKKLRARFPDGWSEEAAAARADVAKEMPFEPLTAQQVDDRRNQP